jgi:hypothetical protein
MPRVGFETTIPVFERAKTVHALDGAATVIGFHLIYPYVNFPRHCGHTNFYSQTFTAQPIVTLQQVFLGEFVTGFFCSEVKMRGRFRSESRLALVVKLLTYIA